jgi:sulfur-oxidizing protein SoxY
VKRRRFLRGFLTPLAAALGVPSRGARAQVAAIDPTVQSITKGARLAAGRVKLEMPVIADNGNAVPLRVSVESPMTGEDFVRAVHLVSDRNPMRHMATFRFSAQSGRAQLATRVRLAGSQTVTALAEMSDGTFWMDRARVQVTLSACIDESDWNK